MTLQSPLILLFLSVSLVLLGLKSDLKKTLFFILNIVFAGLMFKVSGLKSLGILFIWLLAHYGFLQVLLKANRKNLLFYGWFALTLVWFIFSKKYLWITNLFVSAETMSFNLTVIGYSFILFRLIHLSIEIRDGLLKEVGLVDYLNYNLAFWTFLAGPIQRFPDFKEQQDQMSLANVGDNETLRSLNRIMIGYIKMGVVASWFQEYATTNTFLSDPSISSFLLFFVAFPAYIYINFSGYCDIVIGIAKIVGFTLPENFNHPYIARNMVEFWSRWHITLSEYFRDYLYYPNLASLGRHFPLLLCMTVVGFFSFLIMGIWHGSSINFVWFGLVHATGVVVVNLYTELLRKMIGKKKVKEYNKNVIIKPIAIFVCQFYVIASFLVFQYSIDDLKKVFSVLGGIL